MASCCKASSDLLNYLVLTIIFILGGSLVAASVYLFVTYDGQLLHVWTLWVSLFVGVGLLIVGFIGCSATYKYNRCLFLCYLTSAGFILAVVLIVSIVVTVYSRAIDSLSSSNSQQLLDVTGQEATAYRFVRSFYLGLYERAQCNGGSCAFESGTLVCTEISCTVTKVGDVFASWLRRGTRGLNADILTSCIRESAPHASADAASAWCVSDTVIFDTLDQWSLVTLIALWVLSGLILLLVMSNSFLLCCKRTRVIRAHAVQVEAVRGPHSFKV